MIDEILDEKEALKNYFTTRRLSHMAIQQIHPLALG